MAGGRDAVAESTGALMALTDHWLTAPHWSSDIPLDTPHPRVSALAEHGYVVLRDLADPIPESEYIDLEYMDWKSGGDTNFAPIATADGELDCRGFWKPGEERPDKGGRFTSNAEHCPTHRRRGRVGGRRLRPRARHQARAPGLRRRARARSTATTTTASTPTPTAGWCASWLELTDNPDSFMVLMEQGPDGLPDPATEVRVPLHRGARFVVDTQRLWHVVCHTGTEPRYALISSFESGPALEAWIASQR